MVAPKPQNEAQRQEALDAYNILDSAPEDAFDDLLLIASSICGESMGAITLIDRDRQWLKSKVGLGDVEETSRNDAFCAHTILDPDHVMVVEDTHLDERFLDNPLVLADPELRFYAGAPLVTHDGLALGALCVMGRTPGHLTEQQSKVLQALARQVVCLLELRRVSIEMETMIREQAWYEDKLRHENADLVSQNKLDPLTGLGNRRALREAQDEVLKSGQSAWVALIDIDHFKNINDTHGHPKGDEVLADLAQTLTRMVRPQDTAVRLGGEEFGWLMPKCSASEAYKMAEKFRSHMRTSTNPFCTVSVGLAHWENGGDWSKAMKSADEALYEAKRAGRNQTCVAPAKRS